MPTAMRDSPNATARTTPPPAVWYLSILFASLVTESVSPTVSTSRAEVNAIQAQTHATQEQYGCQVLSDHRGSGHGQRHPAVSRRKIVNDSSQQHVQQPAPYHRASFRRKRTDNSATCRNRFPAEWAALYICSYLLPAIRAAAGFAPFSLYRVGHYRSDPQ
jgi:hypothetical protein